jgi:protease-4
MGRNDSLFRSSIRAFLVSMFAVIGIGFGLVPAIAVMAGAASGGKPTLPSSTSLEVLTDGSGKREILKEHGPLLLRIDISGVIGSEELNAKTLETILTESREGQLAADRVKGILLTINSPGGTVFDADRMYRMIKEYKERYKVPVIAYVDGLCASGGVYVASAADKVIASETSLVGSVGVIINSFINVSQVMEKLGVQAKTITAGEGKDAMNPLRAWKENEEKPYVDITNYFYARFLDIVTANRPQIDRDKLIFEYGANVYPAPEALEKGFIDSIQPSISMAIHQLAADSGIADGNYQLIELKSGSWLNDLFRGENALFSGRLKHQIQWAPGMNFELAGQPLYLYQL